MERRKFIRVCGSVVVGAALGASMFSSCTPIYYAQYETAGDQLVIPLSEFIVEESKAREFVLVNTHFSKYPICIFKTGEEEYTASLMQCTHKGCEVNVDGNAFSCPCHGSEFSSKGEVLEGPATEPLKTFKVRQDKTNIYVKIN